ncbi:PREDICTED: probable tubulin polyglutamylase TTLL9 [Lepidothrix coronata]|uniref:Probable tubulin polyglutamylase TTLL9 n=1 Tax=Lepidothrix coronata TaxID=321398 RepID=A0A6J0HVC4_9PASS|nr:PREDICTED: probable tubulin polyglutamylase TTLL9 [Lepidothrix coronata]
MKSSVPPGSLLVASAAGPGRWLCRGGGDRGRRAPRILPRPFPGCSAAAAHRLLPGREQTKEEKLPPSAVAWEHGAALAAACRRCPRPHKAALLGEEQNLCPAPSRKLSQNSCLAKDLKRFWKQLEKEAGKPEARKCAFILKTLKMPSEYYLFVEAFCKNPGITWVMKLQVWRGGWDRRICLTLVRSDWEAGKSQGEEMFLKTEGCN